MWPAYFNDLIQRFITANKFQQRKYLSGLLLNLNLSKSSKVLDFGCGTGLFVKTFIRHGFDYCGYDIDCESIEYAKKLFKSCRFVTSKEELQTKAPFDLIVANCCFHHIADTELLKELDDIKKLLDGSGKFILIDILAAKNDPSPIHRLFARLERGGYVRFEKEYKSMVEQNFKIISSAVYRTSLFSLKWHWFPIYTDLLVLQCVK